MAAAVGGYLVSSGAGERLLHREIETQLGRLLRGPVAIERVRIRFEGGLRIEATGFAAYPAPDGSVPPALRARRVLADVDSLSLLIGRLELSALRFEAPHLRIERGPDGALSHLPLPRLRRETPSAPAGNEAETLLQRVEAVDGGARALLGETQVARHIEIRDGTLHWLDHRVPLADGAPRELRLELVQGMLDRDWLSGALRVEAEAVLVDGRHAPLPFEIGLRRDEAGHLEWSLAVARIPIETLGSRLGAASATEGSSGTLAARLRLRRVAPDGPLRLDLAGRIRDAAFGPGFALSMLESETLDAAIGLELDASEVRLTEGLLSAGRLRLGFEASLERPLRASSETRIEARLSGLELDELRAVARDLAREVGRDSSTARTVSRLATVLEDGRIESIEATGRARLQRWQALLGGQTRELPSGLVLGSRFAGLSIVTESGDRFDGIRGEAQWAGDRLMLRKLNGSFQGRPLPELEAVIDGVSHLLSGMDETVLVSATPPPLPGLAPLLRLIEPRDADAPSPIRSVTFAFERLDHPLFRYPLRGLGIRVEPLRTGLQIAVREGRWGRAAIEGEVVFFDDPTTPSVTARLALAPSSPAVAAVSTASPDSGESGSARPSADAAPERWGVGHIELELRPGPRLPSRRATGFL
ncbi:MAG TPA: hypothetical protein VKA74_08020, partial [Myxococcota bacterium]|nr:hypothetical protein [Myxococcota bacterium]